MVNNSNNNENNFFDDFLNEITAANLQSQGDMSVIEFANRIIFNNDPDFALYPTQKAILKSFYKEQLEEEEVSILKEWLKEERTTWVKDRKYISLVLEAGRRGSKFLSLNTDVYTSKGFKKIKYIHPGEFVYNAAGKQTKVINETIIYTNKVCYELTFSNNEKVVCSFDHLWRTKSDEEKEFSVKTTEDIIESINLNHCVDETPPLILEKTRLINSDLPVRYITSFKQSRNLPVKCLEVEDSSHVFLITKSFIPTHNCNSESAIIPTTKGDITYKELHQLLTNKEKVGIYTYNFKNTVVDKYITYNIKTELNAIEQTYKIKTTQGKQEIVNEDHPFLTWDKTSKYPYWKKLKDLKVNDYIAVSSVLPIFGEEEIEDNLLEAYAIALTTPSIYNLFSGPAYIQPFLKNVFSKKDIQNFSIPINKILKLTKPKLKFFLSCILKYGTDNRELFELGCTPPEKRKQMTQNIKESFSLIFWLKDFKTEISNLFLKFGINFKIRKNGIKLNLSTSKFTLVDTFGDICYNYPNLRKRLLKANPTSFVDKENIIPPISTYDNSTIYYRYNQNRNYKKTVLKQVVLKQEQPDPKLLDWATNEINWEEIKSITPYKVEQTIALEVEGTNVIGNYIISHNSTMASIIALKEFYDLIILDNPHKKYGILKGSPIAILVMAQSQAQVKETIFAAIRGYANNSRFFTSLQNKGVIEILSEEIRCSSKNVSIYAKHTNSKSLVGYTLKCMLLDEVARFETLGEEGKNKAFEIWENVAAGGSTFGHDFKKVAISSAWEPNDPIEVLYDRAQKDPNTLAFKLTTFQVNLKLQKGITPVIVSDYTNDYIKARREYEGIRFNKFNTFIDLENLNKAATSVSVIDALPCEIDTKTNAGTAHYAGIEITRIAENEIEDAVSFIHVDPALKKDSAALAIARPINQENKWKIQIDALIKWEPHTDNKGLKRIVSFIDIENKLLDISKIRRVGKVTMDQWNSASLIQKLQANGIDAQIASCSRENQFTYYTLFRDLLAHEYIILPKDSLWTNSAIAELSELVLRPNRQIIHPTAGKDIADAIVNAVYQCHQHMIRTGLNLNMGINTNTVASQSLAPLQRINITTPTKTKEQLKIGSAIDKLYNIRKKLK